MTPSLLTWNAPNLITVWLMTILGLILFAFVTKAIQSKKAA